MQIVAAQGDTARPGTQVLATIMPALGCGGKGLGTPLVVGAEAKSRFTARIPKFTMQVR